MDLTAQASSEKYFNCIGNPDDTGTTPGAYCLYAYSTSAGNEGLMELHWIAQTAMGVASTAPTISASTTGLLRFATQLQTSISQNIASTSGPDYAYSLGSNFSVSWYQPKKASYYVNQMRFDPGTKVRAWHFDGRTSTWTQSTDHTILAAEHASGLVMGAACLLGAAALAF